MNKPPKKWYGKWWAIVIYAVMGFYLIGILIPEETSNLDKLENDSLIYSTEKIEVNEYSIFNNSEIEVKSINLIFYDKNTNCSLNGNIFVDNTLLGQSNYGIFRLNRTEYDQIFKFNSTISISGITDYCFLKNYNLPFAEYWYAGDLEDYFINNEDLHLEATLTPRQPRYYLEMQGFVRPEEAKVRLENIELDLRDSLERNTHEIFTHFIFSYVSDEAKFGQEEYWQTPGERILSGGGDCEDWAVYFVSLVRAYNSSIACYVSVWDTHANAICRFKERFIIYDQGQIFKTLNLKPNPLNDTDINYWNVEDTKSWLKNYDDSFGISLSGIPALFNEDELLTFRRYDEFVQWVTSFA